MQWSKRTQIHQALWEPQFAHTFSDKCSIYFLNRLTAGWSVSWWNNSCHRDCFFRCSDASFYDGCLMRGVALRVWQEVFKPNSIFCVLLRLAVNRWQPRKHWNQPLLWWHRVHVLGNNNSNPRGVGFTTCLLHARLPNNRQWWSENVKNTIARKKKSLL